MGEADILSSLRDIHLPNQPIGWWPLAVGWYILAFIILAVFIVGIWFIKRYKQQRRPVKQALLLLQQHKKNYEVNHDKIVFCNQINHLLKRVALIYFPRDMVANLSGGQWVEFLNRTSKGCDFKFMQDLLSYQIYSKNTSIDVHDFFDLATKWIKQRRRRCSH